MSVTERKKRQNVPLLIAYVWKETSVTTHGTTARANLFANAFGVKQLCVHARKFGGHPEVQWMGAL